MKRFWLVLGSIILVGAAGATGALIAHNHSADTVAVTKTSKKSAPAIGQCKAGSLTATLNTAEGGGTAGSTYTNLVVQNTGTTTCTVQGYPAVQMVDANGVTVGSTAEHDNAHGDGALMTLAPTGKASATLRFVDNNYPPGTCKDGSTQLEVTVPGSGGAVNTPTTIPTWCPGFSVSALTQSS